MDEVKTYWNTPLMDNESLVQLGFAASHRITEISENGNIDEVRSRKKVVNQPTVLTDYPNFLIWDENYDNKKIKWRSPFSLSPN